MHVLVTGGAGFIGSHVILELLKRGDTVVNVDNINEYYDPSLKRARMNRFEGKVPHYQIDIADKDALEEVFKEHMFDAVCHLAAQAGVRYSIQNPFIYAQTNYIGTLNILEFSKKYKVPHVVMASTSSVCGKNEKMPFSEDDRVDTPISIYSASKRAGELLAHSYNHLFGLNITILRFFTVYGPWGRPDMALFLFTKAILNDEPIKVFNHGNMKRDFTYIDDTVPGVVRAIHRGPNGFEIFHLGSGKVVPLMEYIHTIEKTLGKQARMDFLPMQDGDVAETCADIVKAKKELGYDPKTGVEVGVPKFIEWYLEYHKD